MKILLVNKFFFLKGGSERVFFQERDFLIHNNINVIDFSMDHPENFSSDYAKYFVSNVDYNSSKHVFDKIRMAVRFIYSFEAVKKIKMLININKPDIAHLHNIYHQISPSIISVLKENNVKIVMTLHDGKVICPNYLMFAKGQPCTSCKGRSFWKPLVFHCSRSKVHNFLLSFEAYLHKWCKAYEKVDLFVSPSRFLAETVSQRIPEEKIQLLHNGIDLSSYSPSFVDKGYPVYLGRLSREKGIETLLIAHNNLNGQETLKVIGSGPLGSNLMNRYKNAEFLGYRSGKELIELLANCAFVVVPSECYENCPMVIIEAMALGKPVIATRIGGIPEQVEDGKTGLLFESGAADELAQKMRLLLDNPEIRKGMGKAARAKVEQQYSLEKHCKELLNIYCRLLSSNQ